MVVRGGGHHVGRTAKDFDMLLYRRNQQRGIRRPLLQNLVAGDELVFGFLNLDQLANSFGLLALPCESLPSPVQRR